MTTRDDPTGPSSEGDERVRCVNCQRLVPRSEAFQPEAEDYLIYFCGLDCYERWRGDARGKPPRPPTQAD